MSLLNKFRVFLLVIVSATSISAPAQQMWGRGLILQTNGAKPSDHLPKIALYKMADGTGLIDSIEFDGFAYYGDTQKLRDQRIRTFASLDLECEIFNIIFLDESPTCVSVFVNALHLTAWFRKQDLEDIGWKPQPYIDIITAKKDTTRYSPPYYPLPSGKGINLREGPGVEFKTIAKLAPFVKAEDKAVFEMRPIGVRSGRWLKVKVCQYNQSDCLEDAFGESMLQNTFFGWIKAIDDATGAPNIWIDQCCEFL